MNNDSTTVRANNNRETGEEEEEKEKAEQKCEEGGVTKSPKSFKETRPGQKLKMIDQKSKRIQKAEKSTMVKTRIKKKESE